ncbi:MAG TPA: amidohydrolase family protein [Gemmatimonadales bacterium]|nr:amidohydrolase family protein [Gemmatimonadales bacterium]
MLSALVAVVAASAHLAIQARADTAVVFTDVTVVPMDRERVIAGQNVIVQDGRITAIGPSATVRVPSGATRIDGRGKYLMPGIAEMHAHVPGEQNPQAVDIMALYVLTGATTIRGMNGTPFQHELKRRIAAGEILGPTLFAVAPPFSGQSVGTPDDERRKVRAYKAAGYQVLKIYPGIPRETYDAIIATAREVGIPYSGHVPPEVGLRHAIASKQSVEHLDGYVETSRGDDAAIADLARATREARIWVTPTMDVWKTILGTRNTDELRRRPELRYVRPAVTDQWTKQTAQFARGGGSFWQTALEQVGMRASPAQIVALRDRILLALHRAGAGMVLGADSPQVFSVPGFSLAREMRAMVEAGVPTYAVLEAATRNPAAFFGQEAEFGTVDVGKRADLILVDGNPLEDIRNVHRQAGVMVRGRWLPKAEIDRRLDEIAARAGSR